MSGTCFSVNARRSASVPWQCGTYVRTVCSEPETRGPGRDSSAWRSGSPQETLAPDWNVAPTKQVHAVLDRPVKGADDPRPVRQLRTLTWGLVPGWAQSPDMGAKMINARAETVHEKPAFRRPFAARRCLLPADGYYEWVTGQEGAQLEQEGRGSGRASSRTS